ncbi:hypothetical protein [Actinacidiphila sp. bgisy167]|uniref:hypothetical protein n=1 Tax=Actinacidiphila sp. bgisy167 TaxID=3413797 RepID=UPI003D753AE3
MSRWRETFARQGGGASVPPRRRPESRLDDDPAPRVLVEDHGGLLVLRPPTEDSLDPADVIDLSRTMASPDGTATIVVAVDPSGHSGLWPRLREVLDTLRADGTRTVRLVLSGAGDDRPGRPATARRIADAWDMTVEAPDGPVMVVPGGSAFVPPGTGGWRRFAPGRAPVPLGPRMPSPRWQNALRRVPATAVSGCVVDQVPAGLLIRPAGSAAPSPGDLFHTVPVDPRRAAVIVGVPFGEDVAASDVVALLEAIPAEDCDVRLVPGGRTDLLPLAQSVSSTLGIEVEVTTGLPLFASDGPMGRYGVRSAMVGTDEVPRWLPYVDAVVCAPAGTADRPHPPRLLRWFAPEGIGGLRPANGPAVNGEFLLSPEWRVVLTRAGLWVGPMGGAPIPHSDRPVNHDGPVIDIGRPGDRLTATLWPVVSRVLVAVNPAVRALTTLHVHATPPDGGRALRSLAAEHSLRVIRFSPVQGVRPAAPGTAGAPGAVGAVGTAGAPGAAGTHGTPAPGPRTPGTPRVGPAAGSASRPQGTQQKPPRPLDERGPQGPAEHRGAPSPAPRRTAPAAPKPGSAAPPPRTPRPAQAPEAQQSPHEAGHAARGPAPTSPRHRSTLEERSAFRGFASAVWERHSSAVRRAMTSLPAPQGQEDEAVHDDLVAVRMYMEQADSPQRHAELRALLRSGEPQWQPFAACLTSGLQWLPPYRGAVLRGAPPFGTGSTPRRGQMLYDAAPISGLPIDQADTVSGAQAAYVIWSITGRAVGALREGARKAMNEIVFAPGTKYRVLDVRTQGGEPLILLRQLPDRLTAGSADALEDADETALARLEQALAELTWGTGPWPARCSGSVGDH